MAMAMAMARISSSWLRVHAGPRRVGIVARPQTCCDYLVLVVCISLLVVGGCEVSCFFLVQKAPHVM